MSWHRIVQIASCAWLLGSCALLCAVRPTTIAPSNVAQLPPGVRQVLAEAREYNSGVGKPQNYPKAFSLFMQAFKAGSKEAEAWLGSMYLRGHGTPPDLDRALVLIRDSSGSGDPVGLRFMGALYQNGFAVPQNYGKASEYYEKAISAGDVNSYGRLGLMYLRGLGMPPDRTKAVAYLTQAASKGDVWAECALGQVYEGVVSGSGQGKRLEGVVAGSHQNPSPDYSLALRYYREADAGGSELAAFRLGQKYEAGRGAKQDYPQALTFYTKAAIRGFAPAQFSLAKLCELGLGSAVDYIDAYVFYSLAARKSSPIAEERLLIVSRKMTSDQRSQAESLLQKIYQRHDAQSGDSDELQEGPVKAG